MPPYPPVAIIKCSGAAAVIRGNSRNGATVGMAARTLRRETIVKCFAFDFEPTAHPISCQVIPEAAPDKWSQNAVPFRGLVFTLHLDLLFAQGLRNKTH